MLVIDTAAGGWLVTRMVFEYMFNMGLVAVKCARRLHDADAPAAIETIKYLTVTLPIMISGSVYFDTFEVKPVALPKSSETDPPVIMTLPAELSIVALTTNCSPCTYVVRPLGMLSETTTVVD